MAKRQAQLDEYFLVPKPKRIPESEESDDDDSGFEIRSAWTLGQEETLEQVQSTVAALEDGLSIDRLDIGNYVRSRVTDEQLIRELLEYPWTPPENFKFPAVQIGKRTRYFQHSYLKRYKWLSYSQVFPGGFCRVCVLFCARKGNVKLHAFVNDPATRRKLWDMHHHCKKHQNTKYHGFAMAQAEKFLNRFKLGQASVIEQLHEKAESDRKKQREIISKTVDGLE